MKTYSRLLLIFLSFAFAGCGSTNNEAVNEKESSEGEQGSSAGVNTVEQQLINLQKALIDGRINKATYNELRADLTPSESKPKLTFRGPTSGLTKRKLLGLNLDFKEDGVFIRIVYDNGPVAKNGKIKIGDKVIAIAPSAGESLVKVSGKTMEEVMQLLNNEIPQLEILHKDDPTPRKYEISREEGFIAWHDKYNSYRFFPLADVERFAGSETSYDFIDNMNEIKAFPDRYLGKQIAVVAKLLFPKLNERYKRFELRLFHDMDSPLAICEHDEPLYESLASNNPQGGDFVIMHVHMKKYSNSDTLYGSLEEIMFLDPWKKDLGPLGVGVRRNAPPPSSRQRKQTTEVADNDMGIADQEGASGSDAGVRLGGLFVSEAPRFIEDADGRRAVRFDTNGKIKWEGHYKNGRADGPFTTYWVNGYKQTTGNYKGGKKEGPWKAWYKNGKKAYVENYKNDKRYGLATHWDEFGRKELERSYKNDIKDGVSTGWYKNGKKKLEVHNKGGKKEGLVTLWYESGQKKSATHFKDDEREGLDTSWHENGHKKIEGHNKDGKKEGLWIVWNEDGNKAAEVQYENGKAVSGKKF